MGPEITSAEHGGVSANDIQNEVRIRDASQSDVHALADMHLQLLVESGYIDGGADQEKLLGLSRDYFARRVGSGYMVTLIAEHAGSVVGFVNGVRLQRPPVAPERSGEEIYVTDTYVVIGLRGRGVASALLDGITKEASRQGADRIWLHTTEAGMSVYESFGFRPVAPYVELVLGSDSTKEG